MQHSLAFRTIENYRLLYDQVFESIVGSVTSSSAPKGYEFLQGVEPIDVSVFVDALQYREMLMQHSADKTTNEEEYRQKLITPLLTQVLGYELASLRPERTLQDFGRIDDLYARDDRYLPIESKQYGRLQGDHYRITKRTNADPIFQTTSYLKGINYKLFERKQTHIDAPYAILTDGLERRLYYKDMLTNDLHPSCLVIRLDQLDLMDTESVQHTLRLFQLFFSEAATRRNGLLDQIVSENETRSLKIKDQLGKQVYDAVEYIANGIYLKITGWSEDKKRMTVDYYKTHFSGYGEDKQAWMMKVLYHESLVYLFRIIFGLYAEDRGLLEAVHIQYGLKEGSHNLLQDLQKKFGNTHGGKDRKSNDHIYQFMQNEDVVLENLYFGPINDKYNGGLFDPKRHPLLAEFDINDRYFLRAVDYLMRTRDPNHKGKLATISYAQLDVRHLGTIYENLLEFSLVENTADDAEILPLSIVNDKGERKATGSYYTPDYIVEYIVQQTVGSKIDDILATQGTVQDHCDQIMTLTVCDPAMGSGHFLIEVVTYIETRIQEQLDTLDEDTQAVLATRYTKSQIASRCVYGVDINYLAVELAKVVMRIKTFEEDTPLQFLDANLKRGNSLIGTRIDQMFDSEKMKGLNQLFNDMHRAKHKTTQAVSQIAATIDTYIGGASTTTKSMDEQKKQIKLKESLFGLLSKRYFEQVHGISSRLGDDLPGTQGLGYKERSKAKKAHLITQWEALQKEYQDLNPFEDRKALRDFYQISLAAYNAKYLLTVPLALEFLPKSHNAINLGFASQVSSMLGKRPTETGGNKNLSLDNIHLPMTKAEEYEHGLTIQQAVDQIIQDINPFHRELEFPTVFAQGGFDCVVGNPPYVRIQTIISFSEDESKFYEKMYESAEGRYDLYILFIELGSKLINEKGIVKYILPHNFMNAKLGKGIRKYLVQSNLIKKIDHFGSYKVFDGVGTYTCIIEISKNNKKLKYRNLDPLSIGEKVSYNKYDLNSLSEDSRNLTNLESKLVLNKMKVNIDTVEKYFKNISRGIITGADSIFILDNGIVEDEFFRGYSKELGDYITIEKGVVKPILMGNDISKYGYLENNKFIIYPHFGKDSYPYEEKVIEENFPKTYDYLKKYKSKLIKKKVKYKTNTKFRYSLHNPRTLDIFENKKIIVPYVSIGGSMTLDRKFYYTNDKCSCMLLKDEYVDFYDFFLVILNSKLTWFYIKNHSSEFSGGYFAYTKLFIEKFPIKLPNNQQPFIDAADTMLDLHATQHELISSAHRLITRRYEIEKLTRKLEKFYDLTFAEFLQELTKKNKVLKSMKLDEEQRLEEWFTAESKKIQDLQKQIDTKDKEIDEMVFDLYELSEEEREVVLKS